MVVKLYGGYGLIPDTGNEKKGALRRLHTAKMLFG